MLNKLTHSTRIFVYKETTASYLDARLGHYGNAYNIKTRSTKPKFQVQVEANQTGMGMIETLFGDKKIKWRPIEMGVNALVYLTLFAIPREIEHNNKFKKRVG